jgi:allantoate deiminase
MTGLAKSVMKRIEALGKISDEEGKLTRTFSSPAMRRANDLVASWMREAGMAVRQDAIGNLIGHYPAVAAKAKTLVLGSHLDTVRDAGKFDGPLGVLASIACVQRLHESGTRLPFAVEVAGFADEEGVRFQSTYLGSRALAGTFNQKDLQRVDAQGISMADAIRSFGGNPDKLAMAKMNRKNLLGYVEVHIEQGPVLEKKGLSVGVVSAIAGQKRYRCRFLGMAGHAGTVPMNLRSDALCAAAEFILSVEAFAKKCAGLVATVGRIEALPGATNVILGEVNLTLDVRHADDKVRDKACTKLFEFGRRGAAKRGVRIKWEQVHAAPSVGCDGNLSAILERAVKQRQGKSILLPSGAGHDAAAMAAIAPVAMLFVRCKGGISHHPAESASEKDVGMAIEVVSDFIEELSKGACT